MSDLPDDPWLSVAEAKVLAEQAVRGDRRALRELGRLARLGSGRAMSVLGTALYLRLGESHDRARDARRARLLLAEAGALGFADALHNLGMLYGEGVPGIPRNPAKRARFLLRSRALGLAAAPPEHYDELARRERLAVAARRTKG